MPLLAHTVSYSENPGTGSKILSPEHKTSLQIGTGETLLPAAEHRCNIVHARAIN
jgi:hypothetical protein